MERRDLRIPLITRERIKVNNAIFPTDESIDLLYREASLLAYRYNNELKAKGAEGGFVSPGRLHASAVRPARQPHQHPAAPLFPRGVRAADGLDAGANQPRGVSPINDEMSVCGGADRRPVL